MSLPASVLVGVPWASPPEMGNEYILVYILERERDTQTSGRAQNLKTEVSYRGLIKN